MPARVRKACPGLGIPAITAALLATVALLSACGEQGSRLSAGAALIDQTSVSGVSAGAYMAGQFQLAHGRDVIGAAIIAGGPYGCAESLYADVMPGPGTAFLNLARAMNGCMLNALKAWGIPDVERLVARAGELAADGRIDTLAAVRDDRVYLFTGREDRTVLPEIVAAAKEFYIALGVPMDRIAFVGDVPAGHGFVAKGWGGRCDDTAAPYIVDCDYDQAGALLSHIYGELQPRVTEPAGQVVSFDQREFLADIGEHGMADVGAVYIPPQCRASPGCRVHIAFHGCGQSRSAVGDAFIRGGGFLPWADANRLIVLFPQVKRTPANPQACWDWWGYTGREFLTRSAPQITAVRRMLERLGSPAQ